MGAPSARAFARFAGRRHQDCKQREIGARADSRRHIAGMPKKLWKIIAHIPGLDGEPGWQEYFVVREVDRVSAIATLLRNRPDLEEAACEVKGEAGPDFLDWLQPDKDVFSIMVVS
jgi:hypothetical protein